MILPLIILTLLSGSGLLLYAFRKVNQTMLNLLIGLGAGSMLSVSLVHILPESLETNENAIYTFIAGFLVIYILEEILTPHAHDHAHGDHAHEDPHEHYDHVALVSWIAICIHTIFDGFGIRAGFGLSETIGYSILFGVALHQVPVSLSLAAIFRESKFRKHIQILLLSIFALTAAIGFGVSDIFLANIDNNLTGLITAFAGGSLLYVATADLLPVIHSQNRAKHLTVLLFLIGCIGMTLVKVWE